MADITYNKINWENEPSHNTPLSAENLNKMDTAIYDLVTKSNSLVPNPAESPTEGLEKLEYDGTVYEVKGGHKILNDSGSILTQKDEMRFGGVYTHNASTITEVDIVREFSTVAEIEALTGEAQKGIQYVEGDADYIPFDAKDIQFDNTGTSFTSDDVDGVLREVDNKVTLTNLVSAYFSHTTGTDKYYIGHNVDSSKAGQITIDTDGLHILNKNSGTWAEKYVLKPIKTKTVTITTSSQGIASLNTTDSQEHILSIYVQDRLALHFWVGSGHANWIKLLKWDTLTPLEETVSVTYTYT